MSQTLTLFMSVPQLCALVMPFATPAPCTTAVRHLNCLGTLQCDDIERSRRFYTEVLGLEILAGFNNAQYIKHATAPWYIVVLKRNPRQYLAPANRFTLQMDSAAAVEQAHSELSTDGEAACITELGKLDARNGKTSFIFSDLDKNWWELTG
jgi:catechol 2,3-dioxygenase-like lactoylglutathione lyase family enzyme